jgi:glycerol-3-phosphate dehydrogenase
VGFACRRMGAAGVGDLVLACTSWKTGLHWQRGVLCAEEEKAGSVRSRRPRPRINRGPS